jgi:hypothetical protein
MRRKEGDVREPAYFARQREEKPELPEGACERVCGYRVMRRTFAAVDAAASFQVKDAGMSRQV